MSQDVRYEGLESLVLTIELVDSQPGVLLTPNRNKAYIHIIDHEDSELHL